MGQRLSTSIGSFKYCSYIDIEICTDEPMIVNGAAITGTLRLSRDERGHWRNEPFAMLLECEGRPATALEAVEVLRVILPALEKNTIARD